MFPLRGNCRGASRCARKKRDMSALRRRGWTHSTIVGEGDFRRSALSPPATFGGFLSLRLGHGSALTVHRTVIHYLADIRLRLTTLATRGGFVGDGRFVNRPYGVRRYICLMANAICRMARYICDAICRLRRRAGRCGHRPLQGGNNDKTVGAHHDAPAIPGGMTNRPYDGHLWCPVKSSDAGEIHRWWVKFACGK